MQHEDQRKGRVMKPRVIDGKTIADVYLRRIDLCRNDRVFLVKRNGKYEPMTWDEVHNRVLGIFSSYQKLGIKPGDKICIMSQSRPEWCMADMANFCYGAISVPVYHSNIASD